MSRHYSLFGSVCYADGCLGVLYPTLSEAVCVTGNAELYRKAFPNFCLLHCDSNEVKFASRVNTLNQKLKEEATKSPCKLEYPTIIDFKRGSFQVYNGASGFFECPLIRIPLSKEDRVKMYNCLVQASWKANACCVDLNDPDHHENAAGGRSSLELTLVVAKCPLCSVRFRLRKEWNPPMDMQGLVDWTRKWTGGSRNMRMKAKRHWERRHSNLKPPPAIQKSYKKLSLAKLPDGSYDHIKAQQCRRRDRKLEAEQHS